MVEYVEEDAVSLKGALRILILKCTEEMCNSLDCTITFGDLALDCHFNFSMHEETEKMIKMIEFDEGVWVPEECCTMMNPTTSGGESVPDDVEMPCEGSESCTGECSECVIQRIMNDYARCAGQTAGLELMLTEIIECARQEDTPIYEGDKEVDQWVRLSDVTEIISKYMT